MLNVLTEFIRLSALISAFPSSSKAQPRKEWFDILALLLTRAVLEGYMLHGWRGSRAAQVLFGFGSTSVKGSPALQKASKAPRDDSDDDSDSDSEDEEAEFSPDGYPKLWDACSNLFANSSSTVMTAMSPLRELRAFREEMGRRRTEFLSPSQLPSGGLEAHLDALNEKYSAEELDKKMIEFVERVAECKGGAALERTKRPGPTGIRLDGKFKVLAKYFQIPSSADPTPMAVDASSEDTDSGGDETSQSEEDEDSSADERTPISPAIARVAPPPSSSKRPRAPSLSDDVQTLAGQQSSLPPLKRERLGASPS